MNIQIERAQDGGPSTAILSGLTDEPMRLTFDELCVLAAVTDTAFRMFRRACSIEGPRPGDPFCTIKVKPYQGDDT